MPRAAADTALLHRVGRAIARARLARGWTQDALAHALGISVKNAQRLESGRHDLRLTTMARAAAALGVNLPDLLSGDETVPESGRASGPLAGLGGTGWEAVRKRTERGEPLVPVLDLRPQAGRARPQAMATRVGWARPPEGRRLHGEGYLLARVRGDSMAPEIADGTWCLFHQPVTDVQVKKRVLVRLADADPAAGGAWMVKRIGAIEATERGMRLRLDSTNPHHAPQWLEVEEGDDRAVVAEVVEVLGTHRARPGR